MEETSTDAISAEKPTDERQAIAPATRMMAIVQDEYGTADVLKFEEVDRPAVKAPDEVLIEVKAAGVDPGVWHIMTGLPYICRLAFGIRRPSNRIRGFDVAGIVRAVGSQVTRLQPGDEVFGNCYASFAEYSLAKESTLTKKPANITFEQAASAPISAITAIHALRDTAQVKAGDKVAVIGAAGGVGSFAVQLAKHYGAEVTGICSTAKVERVKSLGADYVIDYTKEDFTEKGPVFDVILDTAGNRPLATLRRALAPKGALALVGGEGAGDFFGLGRQLKALFLSPFTSQRLGVVMSMINDHKDLDTLKDLLEAGTIIPLMDKSYPLKDAAEAVRYIEKGHAGGKVVLTI